MGDMQTIPLMLAKAWILEQQQNQAKTNKKFKITESGMNVKAPEYHEKSHTDYVQGHADDWPNTDH